MLCIYSISVDLFFDNVVLGTSAFIEAQTSHFELLVVSTTVLARKYTPNSMEKRLKTTS